jgi:RNA polymerase sigma-70 factor (ECF subfamily)
MSPPKGSEVSRTDRPYALGWVTRWLQRTSPLATAEQFAALYQRAHLTVFRYVYGLSGGPQAEAEDLTAEAFTRAWEARNRFRGDDGAAVGWLLQIARRLVIDRYRRERFRGPTASLPDDLEAAEPGPEAQALTREQRRTLWARVQALPLEGRELLVLRYMLGWRVKDIARHLGLNENTASAAVRRALARLRRDWPAEEENDVAP